LPSLREGAVRRRRLVLLLACAASLHPALAQPTPETALDQLLAALRTAASEQDAALIATQLELYWLRAGSPATGLLLGRALRDLRAGDTGEAEQDCTDALTLDPTLSEAYDLRARAELAHNALVAAKQDALEAIRREPRNIIAWQTLSRIAEAQHLFPGRNLNRLLIPADRGRAAPGSPSC
jgi:tetratricopeptide (TPR) repeat protein